VICASLPSFASSRLLTWVLAGRPAPYLRWPPVPSAALGYSFDQVPVSEPLPGRVLYEAVEPIEGVPRHIALVEPESELVNVAAKMLRADVMERAVNPALQDGPDALDPIGCHVIPDVLSGAVHDALVLEQRANDAVISAGIIRVNSRAWRDHAIEKVFGGIRVNRFDGQRYGVPAALPHTDNGSLADRAATGVQFLVLVLVGFLPADVGFVDFDDAGELAEILAARLAQPAEDEPRGLLRDANFLRQLHRRDALARGHNEIHRVNPLVQRNVRPLENSAGANREILFALVAAVEAAFALRDPLAETTDRAARTIRPEPAFKPDARRFRIRNHLKKLKGRNRALAHGLTLSSGEDYTDFGQGSKLYNSLKKPLRALSHSNSEEAAEMSRWHTLPVKGGLPCG